MSSYGAPTPSDTLNSALHIRLFEVLSALKDFGFSNDQILALLKLGRAGARLLGELYQQEPEEGQETVDELLGSLEGTPDETLRGWLGAIANTKNNSGRGKQRAQIPSRRHSTTIDNKNDAMTPATAPATPYLFPPPPSDSLHPSSAHPTSPSPSPSPSTNLTHPSSVKRPKLTPKSVRKLLCCPACTQRMKNGFDKHFTDNCLPYLFAEKPPDETELIGCGYCPCSDLEANQGKAFLGTSRFVRHVHDAHTHERLRWDFDAAFKNLLSHQDHVRRLFLVVVQKAESQLANASPQYSALPLLSWRESEQTWQVLRPLQILGAKINGVPSHQILKADERHLIQLLMQAYQAASRSPPPVSPPSTTQLGAPPQFGPATPSLQPPFQYPQPASSPQPPLDNKPGNDLDFAAMGQMFVHDQGAYFQPRPPRGDRIMQLPMHQGNPANHPDEYKQTLQQIGEHPHLNLVQNVALPMPAAPVPVLENSLDAMTLTGTRNDLNSEDSVMFDHFTNL